MSLIGWHDDHDDENFDDSFFVNKLPSSSMLEYGYYTLYGRDGIWGKMVGV